MRNLSALVVLAIIVGALSPRAQAQSTPTSPATASSRLRFFVSPYEVGEGSPVDSLTANEILAARVSRLGRTFRFVTADEVRKVLDHEALKQMLGSDDDSSTLRMLGHTIQADRLLHGRMGKVGHTYVATLTLIDLSQGRVEKRVAGTFRGQADLAITRLNQQSDEMLAYLLQTYAPDKIKKRRVAVKLGKSTAHELHAASSSLSQLDLAGVGLIGLGAGLAAGGGAMHLASGVNPPLWLTASVYGSASLMAVTGGVLLLLPESAKE